MSRLTRDGTAEPVSRDQIKARAAEGRWMTTVDIYSAFEQLLGTWPSACYPRLDVLSYLLDSLLYVGLSCCYSAFELLLGTWPSACYQRVDVLLQLLGIYSAFELLLGTWPSACYQRVDVLSQLLDSPLHVGFRNYHSSPTRRARTKNKKKQ